MYDEVYMYVCIYKVEILYKVCKYVCMYVSKYLFICYYVYFNEWRSNRVLVRLRLDSLIGVIMYVCMYATYMRW